MAQITCISYAPTLDGLVLLGSTEKVVKGGAQTGIGKRDTWRSHKIGLLTRIRPEKSHYSW